MIIKSADSESGQICRICKIFKQFFEYHTRNTKLGYRKECKTCRCLRQQAYSKTQAGKKVQAIADQKRNKKFPERRKARSFLSKAVKEGLVIPLPCVVCGDVAEAHHPDYSEYLAVTWLCKPHHKQVHQQNVN
jgi:hypothetical protein